MISYYTSPIYNISCDTKKKFSSLLDIHYDEFT